MVKSVKKVAEKFGSLEISRTFALPFEKRAADEAGSSLEDWGVKIKNEKFLQKSLEVIKKCLPLQSRLRKRRNKFIEKTDLLYKKQVPRKTIYREALILLKEL